MDACTATIIIGGALSAAYVWLARQGRVFPFTPFALIESHEEYPGDIPHIGAAWYRSEPYDYPSYRQNRRRDLFMYMARHQSVRLYTMKMWHTAVDYYRYVLLGEGRINCHMTARYINGSCKMSVIASDDNQ